MDEKLLARLLFLIVNVMTVMMNDDDGIAVDSRQHMPIQCRRMQTHVNANDESGCMLYCVCVYDVRIPKEITVCAPQSSCTEQ